MYVDVNMLSKQLEKRIITKANAIRGGKLSIENSNIDILFNELQVIDEVSFLNLVIKYKEI